MLLVLGACSKLTRVLKNPNVEEKYQAALDYYEDGDYYRASLVFEDLLPNMIGTAEAEQIQFYYAYTQYHQNLFEMSSYYFKQFHDTYRRSDYAEEALFMHAYSLYKSTPDYNLDQSNTDKAINELQDFINRYPQSEYVAQSEDLIMELRDKLEMKGYTVAKQYHKLRYYKAALVAYENFQRDFPDSELKEEVAYLMVEAQYELAKASILSLQQERYEKALKLYYNLVDKYPESNYLKTAEDYFENSQRELGAMKKSEGSSQANR